MLGPPLARIASCDSGVIPGIETRSEGVAGGASSSPKKSLSVGFWRSDFCGVSRRKVAEPGRGHARAARGEPATRRADRPVRRTVDTRSTRGPGAIDADPRRELPPRARSKGRRGGRRIGQRGTHQRSLGRMNPLEQHDAAAPVAGREVLPCLVELHRADYVRCVRDRGLGRGVGSASLESVIASRLGKATLSMRVASRGWRWMFARSCSPSCTSSPGVRSPNTWLKFQSSCPRGSLAAAIVPRPSLSPTLSPPPPPFAVAHASADVAPRASFFPATGPRRNGTHRR